MKKIIKTLLISSVIFTTASAHAAYIYERSFRSTGRSYIKLLSNIRTDNPDNLPSDQRRVCEDRYSGILKDNLIDIRIALGYFDWTTGNAVHDAGRSYGVSPSIDIGAFAALRDLLKSSCYGRQRFCGFKTDRDNTYVFRKQVTIDGKKYPVRLEMHFSSATEILGQNKGSQQQRSRTQYTENFFLKGLQSADAIFYFGHARNGGGPDFAPPIFVRGTNKVDYNGYYMPNKPGFSKMLDALRSGRDQAPIIGLMSCNSRYKFLGGTRKAAPDSGVITSTNVLDVDIVYTAMIGAVDAILRGQCQKSFYQSLRMTAKNRAYITMDGMFE
ncbi:hypothetical protein D3C87_109820 [compost metagenome]